jgi:hypothetical protein
MKRQSAFGFAAALLLGLGGPCLGAERTLVIHAGQLFDGKSDALSSNQVIVVQGDRIAEVGPASSVKIPAGAEQIDLGTGTVLPGLIEGHNHVFKIGDYPARVRKLQCPPSFSPGRHFPCHMSRCSLPRMRSSTSCRALPPHGICPAAARRTSIFATRSTTALLKVRAWSLRRKGCGGRPQGLVTSTSWTRRGKDESKCAYSSRMERISSRFT